MDRPCQPGLPAARICAAIERALADDAEVAAAFLFGSHAVGRARPESDVDVAVLLRQDPVSGERYRVVRRLLAELATELAGERLDLVLLNHAPPVLAFRVLRDGLVALSRDPVGLHRFRVRTYRLHADLAAAEALFRRATRERVVARGSGG